jgi:hypothetical protein
MFQESNMWKNVAYYVSNDTVLNMMYSLSDSLCPFTSHC